MKRKISKLGPKEGILCQTKELFLKIVRLPGATQCSFLNWEWNKEDHIIFPFDKTHTNLKNIDNSYIIYPASDFLEENQAKEFSHYNNIP